MGRQRAGCIEDLPQARGKREGKYCYHSAALAAFVGAGESQRLGKLSPTAICTWDYKGVQQDRTVAGSVSSTTVPLYTCLVKGPNPRRFAKDLMDREIYIQQPGWHSPPAFDKDRFCRPVLSCPSRAPSRGKCEKGKTPIPCNMNHDNFPSSPAPHARPPSLTREPNATQPNYIPAPSQSSSRLLYRLKYSPKSNLSPSTTSS